MTSFGKFLRILDEDGKLSLTNISLMAVLVHCMAVGFSTQSSAALLFVLSAYVAKRYLRAKHGVAVTDTNLASDVETLKRELDLAKNKISSLSVAASIRPFTKR